MCTGRPNLAAGSADNGLGASLVHFKISPLTRVLGATLAITALTVGCQSAGAELCCFVGTKTIGGTRNRTIGGRHGKSTKVLHGESNHELSTHSKPPRVLRPTEIRKPCHYIKPMDPAHPNMRTYIDGDRAISANLLPENSFWKDHDSEVTWIISQRLPSDLIRCSQADGGHPNGLVLKRKQMNDSEISDHVWEMLKE
jgi:hypothetical protein